MKAFFVWGIEAKLFIREMKANIVLGYEGQIIYLGNEGIGLFGKLKQNSFIW